MKSACTVRSNLTGTRRMTLRFSEDICSVLAAEAHQAGKSMTAIAEEAITSFLTKREKRRARTRGWGLAA